MTSSKITHSNKKTSTPSSREEVTKMNVNIPKDFYKKIKQRALDEDTTVTEIVLKALSQYLNR